MYSKIYKLSLEIPLKSALAFFLTGMVTLPRLHLVLLVGTGTENRK